MLIFFKPPQSLLQAQLLDPDGFPNRRVTEEELYEAQLVEKILKERRRKQDRKLKSKRLKRKIKKELEQGVSEEEIVKSISEEILSLEERYPFTDERRADVDRILDGQKQRMQEELDSAIKAYYALIKSEYDNALGIYTEQQAAIESAKRKKLLRSRRLKVLLLLANMDDDEQV